MLHPAIADHLTHDDDIGLWDVALSAILGRAEAAALSLRENVFAEIGSCRHWISPHHPIQWVNNGFNFAWPFGYDKTTTGWSYRALPQFSWSELLRWTGDAWVLSELEARSIVCRISIPARTARHLRASVHTLWTPHGPFSKEKAVELYGFRKKAGAWSEAAYEELLQRKRSG